MKALRTFTKIGIMVTNTCSTFFRAYLVVTVGASVAGQADTFVELVAGPVGPGTMIWALCKKEEVSNKCVHESQITFQVSIVLTIV